MLKKIISAFLAVFIFTAVSGANVFARAVENENEKKTATVKDEKNIEKKDFANLSKTENGSLSKLERSAFSRAEYKRQKAQDNKFSTKTEVLIGVGIAATVVGIVVFAASRDKVRTF